MAISKQDSHPARRAWAMYQKTPEYADAIKLHDEAALWAGFIDGWMYGRDRRDTFDDMKSK